MNRLRVLVVDDEQELRKHIVALLMSTFTEYILEFDEAQDGQEALDLATSTEFDLIFLDVRIPKINGLDVLHKLKNYNPSSFVVILTAHSNVKDAVYAIKEGAYDYLSKPLDRDRLTEIVRASLEARALLSDVSLSNPIFDDDIETEIIGNSQKMKDLYSLIAKLAKVDTTVMIRGENGTGKELVARAIHLNSPRKSKLFVALNCGAIPEDIIESELFGHERGSFTGAHQRKLGKFQLASEGTLFLDEIGELKPEIQVKLLRVLQEKKFIPVGSNREIGTQARILTATNQNLEKKIDDGEFREDLFYRLNVMPIFLPPLRERREDIESLVSHFLKKHSLTHNRSLKGVHPDAMALLKNYDWPGNIRELGNAIERAFVVETSSFITTASLPDSIKESSLESSHEAQSELDFENFKNETEKNFIIEALKANQGRINKTVANANIPKNTLLRKIKKYGIDVKKLN